MDEEDERERERGKRDRIRERKVNIKLPTGSILPLVSRGRAVVVFLDGLIP